MNSSVKYTKVTPDNSTNGVLIFFKLNQPESSLKLILLQNQAEGSGNNNRTAALQNVSLIIHLLSYLFKC